jgi:hypothetical protein
MFMYTSPTFESVGLVRAQAPSIANGTVTSGVTASVATSDVEVPPPQPTNTGASPKTNSETTIIFLEIFINLFT